MLWIFYFIIPQSKISLYPSSFPKPPVSNWNQKQSEIARVTEKYKKLKAKAEQACANSDKLKKVMIRALAVWEILTDHVSGTHLVSNCVLLVHNL
jgi:hypothetical protein